MELKSGIKTTEFVGVLATMITYILVSTGVISSDKAGPVGELVLQGVTGVVALGSLIAYILSRTDLKKTALNQPKTDEVVG